MLHFVVAAARQRSARSRVDALLRRHGTLTPAVDRFFDELQCPTIPASTHHVRWSSAKGRLHVVGWTTEDPSIGWRVGDTGLVVHAGRGLLVEPPLGRVATIDALAELGRRDRVVDLLPRLEGAYALVRLDDDGSGELANDPVGLHLLYWAQTPTTTYVSNKALLVGAALQAETGRAPARDAHAMLHVALVGNMLGTETGFCDVRTIPFGTSIRLGADGEIDFPPAWPNPWDLPRATEGLTEATVDAVEDRMIKVIQATLATSPTEPCSQLTAGKDSRLVLALLKRAGLMSDFQFVSYGLPTTPDVRGASAIARRLDLRFRRENWPIPADFTDQFALHVTSVAGEIGCWESGELHGRPDGVILSGMVGETLRSGYPKMVQIDYPVQLERRLRRLLALRIDLLDAARAEEAIVEIIDLATAPNGVGHPAHDLIDIYFIAHRQRRWIGAQMDRLEGQYMPLYTAIGLQAGFALGPDDKVDETLRRALMERAQLGLEDVKMGKKKMFIRRPPRVPTPGGTWNQRPQRVKAARHYVEANADNPAFTLLDRDKVIGALDGYDALVPRKQIELHWALTPVIWLGGFV